MGMFDQIICECDLPVKGFEDEVFQTKSFPCAGLELFKIGKDKHLYLECYDVVDRSDPDAEGLLSLKGMLTRINKRFEKSNYSGEIRFYTTRENDNETNWFIFSSYFIEGELKTILVVDDF